MAPIESEQMKSRCVDGVDFDLINKVRKDVSSESKPPAAFVPYPSDGSDKEVVCDESNSLSGPRPCCCCHAVYKIGNLDLKPPLTIVGTFVFPCFKAFVEEMTAGSSNDKKKKKKNSVLIVIGNLPFETRNIDLLQLFQSFGHVISADVAFDQNSGCSGRFGFVNFATREAAQSAIEKLNGIDYHNFVLRVKWPNQQQPKY